MTDLGYLYNLKGKTRAFYDSLGNIYCPILDEWIVFNSRGFHHLTVGGNGSVRSISQQTERLRLFPLAIPVIKQAGHITEYRREKLVSQVVQYWSLVGYMGKKRSLKIRVVLKQTGNGKIIFWSIFKDC